MHNVQRINYRRDNYSKTARRQWSNRSAVVPPTPPCTNACLSCTPTRHSLRSERDNTYMYLWSVLGRIIYIHMQCISVWLCEAHNARRRVYIICAAIFFLNPGVMWWRREHTASPWPRHSDHEPTTRAPSQTTNACFNLSAQVNKWSLCKAKFINKSFYVD